MIQRRLPGIMAPIDEVEEEEAGEEIRYATWEQRGQLRKRYPWLPPVEDLF